MSTAVSYDTQRDQLEYVVRTSGRMKRSLASKAMTDQLAQIESKIDEVLVRLDQRGKTQSPYLTAKDVGKLLGLDPRTIINRSNLPRDDDRYIPSVNLKGSRRKYFERKVIQRLFSVG